MKRRLVVPFLGLPVLAALTLSVAACGGDDGSSAPSATIPAGALVVGAGPGLVFDANTYSAVSTNGSVVIAFVQKDTQRHTLLVKDAAGIIVGEKLEVVKKNDVDVATYSLAPDVYQIYCDVPGHGTMKATLTVT